MKKIKVKNEYNVFWKKETEDYSLIIELEEKEVFSGKVKFEKNEVCIYEENMGSILRFDIPNYIKESDFNVKVSESGEYLEFEASGHYMFQYKLDYEGVVFDLFEWKDEQWSETGESSYEFYHELIEE